MTLEHGRAYRSERLGDVLCVRHEPPGVFRDEAGRLRDRADLGTLAALPDPAEHAALRDLVAEQSAKITWLSAELDRQRGGLP